MGATYFCSPNGTKDGKSYEQPCSLEFGLKMLAPDDTLFCLGGQYDFEASVEINHGGTEEKRICIFNYPDEKPIFDFRREPYRKRGVIIPWDKDWIHLKGLTIRYAGSCGLYNGGSNSIFENIDSYGNCDTGIQMGHGRDNLIIYCDSHDNFDYKLGGLEKADFGGNADGFADKLYTGGTNTYKNCRSWNNSDDGWDFYKRESEEGTAIILENCICYNNGPLEYDMRNHPRYETDKEWFDQFLGEGIDVKQRIRGTHRVTLEHYINDGNANGFKMGGEYTHCNVRATNCIAIGNNARGFDQNNNYGIMTLTNCSAMDNNPNFGFYANGGGKLIISNYLSASSRRPDVFKCQTVVWNK